MSLGLWFAVLALAQLLLPWLANRVLAGYAQPWFIEQAKARGVDGLEIAEFFTEPKESVEPRANAVLDMAELVGKSTSVLTALFVSLVGLTFTGALVLASCPPVEFRNERLTALVLGLALAFIELIILVGRISARTLREHSSGEGKFRNHKRRVVRVFGPIWYRLTRPELFTRYYAVVIVANAVSILAAVNL